MHLQLCFDNWGINVLIPTYHCSSLFSWWSSTVMWSNRFPLNRHRTALQLLATLANLATTWRFLHDYSLPGVFLCLPIGLILLPLVERYTILLDDRFTRLAVTGVATGVNCGFLSTVANIYRTQVIGYVALAAVIISKSGPSAVRFKIGHPLISSTIARSSNEWQSLGTMSGYQDSNGRQATCPVEM